MILLVLLMFLNSRCHSLDVTAQLMLHLLSLQLLVARWLGLGHNLGAYKKLDLYCTKGGSSIHLGTHHRLYLDCIKGGSSTEMADVTH
jgi:hypothetical protein